MVQEIIVQLIKLVIILQDNYLVQRAERCLKKMIR